MPDVVVLQRRIPHYRVDLFEQLFARFGWAIAASPDAKSPQGPAFYYYPMPEERRFGRTVVAVPLARILTELKPKAVIAEYSFKMTSTWDLIAGRWTRGAAYTLLVTWVQHEPRLSNRERLGPSVHARCCRASGGWSRVLFGGGISVSHSLCS